ncbi:hypothetical protein DV735_g2727, partial [Chaetothyriales sp. CBS 134920]
MVDNHVETAEPHDVRQVWVANQVAGSGQLSFKASHGGFLSCDAVGVASRAREGEGGNRYLAAVVVKQEVKKEEDEDDDDIERRQQKQKNVAISLRGDGEAGEPATELVIKMQARFKPRVQQSKASKAQEKVSRREMEQAVGRRLEDDEVKRLKRARKNGTYHEELLDHDEVKRLKRARKNGTYHEELLDVRVKGKHDKFA